MSIAERFRGGIDNVIFLLKHDSTPEIVERARKVVVQNEQILQGWLDAGLVTRERLQEIENDGELQQEYKTIMRHARDGGENADKAMQKLTNLPLDKQAGWLEYFRKFHEKRFTVNLLREEEITAKD